MYIHGIGIISSVGRGIEAHRQALTDASLPAVVDGFHRVSEKDLKDPILVKEARRADRFDRMAILAGLDALADAGIYSDASLSTVGLILATGFGPHTTTFRFLDDLLNFKEKDVSPTLFSHSVHNAAASYLSLLARIHGPTLTVTRFFFAFEEALSLARSWLEQQRCEHVLAGVVDELGSVMENIIRFKTKYDLEESKRLSAPFVRMNAVSGEGGAFFVLSKKPSKKSYGGISPKLNDMALASASDQILFLSSEHFSNSKDNYYNDVAVGSLASVESLFGRQPCPSALNCATAALLLNDSKLYQEMNPELYLRKSSSLPESCISICRNYQGIARAIKINKNH